MSNQPYDPYYSQTEFRRGSITDFSNDKKIIEDTTFKNNPITELSEELKILREIAKTVRKIVYSGALDSVLPANHILNILLDRLKEIQNLKEV